MVPRGSLSCVFSHSSNNRKELYTSAEPNNVEQPTWITQLPTLVSAVRKKKKNLGKGRTGQPEAGDGGGTEDGKALFFFCLPISCSLFSSHSLPRWKESWRGIFSFFFPCGKDGKADPVLPSTLTSFFIFCLFSFLSLSLPFCHWGIHTASTSFTRFPFHLTAILPL